jgi:adenylate kinase
MSVTVVAGVPGVGLSTLVEHVRPELDDEFELINFGDVMLEQAAVADLATSRSELGDLSQRETRRLQRRAGEFVADRAESRRVLLTTHLVVETAVGFLPGLPDAVLEDVAPDRLVIVEAEPSLIDERRSAADREYGDASVRAVEFEQDLNRTAAFEYAVSADAPISLVENEGDIEAAVATMEDVLDGD